MLDIISTPFGYLMRYLYQWTSNYALSLLIFALVVKLVLLPLTIHQRKSSVTQARLRPKEKAIRKRYEGRTDAESRLQMGKELQDMYKEEHYSVAGGCLPLLIQFPIIIALYNIVRDPLTHITRLSADAVSAIQTKALELIKAGSLTVSGATAESTALTQIQMSAALQSNPDLFAGIEGVGPEMVLPNFSLFGVDLSATPTLALSLIIIFPLLAGAFQWLSSFIMGKMMPAQATNASTGEGTAEAEAAAKTMKSMNIVMPLLTVYIAFQLPAIMSLYWVYQSILGTLVTFIVYKMMPLPTFTDEEYAAIEAEMNKDYVPIPAPKTSSSGSARSLHHIDDEDEYEDGETVEVTDYTEVTDGNADTEESEEITHREESAPRVRYDKNGNPIRSLHYIDFDEEENAPTAENDTTNE